MKSAKSSREGFPEGPSSAFWTSVRYARDPVGLYRALTKYGDGHTVTMPLLLGPIVGAISPQSAKDILTADTASLDIFGPEALAMVFRPRSLVMLSGEQHARERKLLMPAFNRADAVRAYAVTMQETALQYASEIAVGKPFVMQKLAQRILLQVVIRDVFGVTEPDEQAELKQRVRELFEASSPALIFFPGLRHRFGGIGPYANWQRADARLTRLIHDLIARRRASPPGSKVDVLSLLLTARYEDGSVPSDEVVHDELMALFFAGHAATATTISWVFHWLHRYPETLAKLRAELATLPQDVEPTSYMKLPYLEAVCNETLRIYPPVADLYRKLRVPLRIGSTMVPAGTGVAVFTTIIHAREDLFPEPMRFRPERFAERSYTPFEFLPYGVGARRCIGAAFAHQALKIVVASILRRWELGLETPDEPAVRQGVGVGPKHGVRMRILRNATEEQAPGATGRSAALS
ncbi:cytochrome P450 [Stigmatella aurantiaca]|nr:cytochrome P450 [Stigmatella aurantiaca]ADO72992.1 Cytochrome P450 monooxygenase AufH [Stigmatella aurantiaca DW4/3-1]